MLSRCPHCDRPFVQPDAAERPRCPHCGKDTEEQPSGSADEPRSAVVAEGSRPNERAQPPAERRHAVRPPPPRFLEGRPAWEQRDRSLPARFFGTLADACLRPNAFFTNLSREGVRGVTWFGYACLLLGTAGQAAWGIFSLPFLRSIVTQATQTLPPEAREAARAENSALLNALVDAVQSSEKVITQLTLIEAQLWATLILAPLTAFFTIHLLAGLVHFSVQTFRPPDHEPVSYDVTYRFLVYAFAPMAFGVIPTVGGLAGLYSFALMLIAMSRLHRVRWFGLIGGVLFPILLLSWLWDQEAMPRLAPHVTRALGVVEEVQQPEPEQEQEQPAGTDEDEAASSYPPMPAADRDHGVEVHEKSGWLYSERTWEASFGEVRIRQLVQKDKSDDGGHSLILEVKNLGDKDITDLFVSHTLPVAARLQTKDEAVRVGVNDAPGADDIVTNAAVGERDVHASFSRLPEGATAIVGMRAKGASARALLDTAPSVGREHRLETTTP